MDTLFPQSPLELRLRVAFHFDGVLHFAGGTLEEDVPTVAQFAAQAGMSEDEFDTAFAAPAPSLEAANPSFKDVSAYAELLRRRPRRR